MHAHSEIRHSTHEPGELFTLVVDIERYPEFLPWCRAARVIERHDGYFIGELIIAFSGFTERYTSKVTPKPFISSPLQGGSERGVWSASLLRDPHLTSPLQGEVSIEVELVKGPFTTLSNHWKFEPAPQGGTNIHFGVEFEFKSKLLDNLMGGFFGRAVDKMGDAFVKRANQLYS